MVYIKSLLAGLVIGLITMVASTIAWIILATIQIRRQFPQGEIGFDLRSAIGDPIPYVDVALLKPAYDTEGQRTFRSQQTRTNDLGEYRLFWVTPGTQNPKSRQRLRKANSCYDFGAMSRRRHKPAVVPSSFPDPYREMWVSLTPAERLRRSWKLRRRLQNLKMSHDAKTFQQL